MEIIFLESVDSTQAFLQAKLANSTPPLAVFTQNQTNGIGSRGRSWQGKKGNFFLSFALDKSSLSTDLPLHSASIYFAYLLKDILAQRGSEAFVKWPNDIYIGKKKIGGVITNLSSDVLVCGIGLNLIPTDPSFGVIDINMDIELFLGDFFSLLEKQISWQEVFSKLSVEFYKNFGLITHHNGKKISFEDCSLASDGSLEIANERIFNLR